MARTKDMALLPGRIVGRREAIRLGGEGQVGALHPPLEGAGRLVLSAAKCETGRGDSLSTRALSDAERPSPRPAASRRPAPSRGGCAAYSLMDGGHVASLLCLPYGLTRTSAA